MEIPVKISLDIVYFLGVLCNFVWPCLVLPPKHVKDPLEYCESRR